MPSIVLSDQTQAFLMGLSQAGSDSSINRAINSTLGERFVIPMIFEFCDPPPADHSLQTLIRDLIQLSSKRVLEKDRLAILQRIKIEKRRIRGNPEAKQTLNHFVTLAAGNLKPAMIDPALLKDLVRFQYLSGMEHELRQLLQRVAIEKKKLAAAQVNFLDQLVERILLIRDMVVFNELKATKAPKKITV